MQPRFREWKGTGSALDFVVSLNLKRRHLNESQRGMIASGLATTGKGRPKNNRPIGLLSQPEAAEKLSVTLRTVKRAVQVRDHGNEELVEAVESGRNRRPLDKAIRSAGYCWCL